jgi:hypothetical protein
MMFRSVTKRANVSGHPVGLGYERKLDVGAGSVDHLDAVNLAAPGLHHQAAQEGLAVDGRR